MIGQTLGHYQIVAKIGAGGMGEVYRAHDKQLDRDVALKVLPAGTLADEAARKQFRKEALALAKLNHPNIETVHEFSSQDGVDFLVMELIPGHPLTQKLQGRPLPEREIVRLGIQFVEGLAAAHEQGVVHRDLKPGNLIVTPEGRLKILDFGLALLVHTSADPDMTRSITQETGTVSGTVPYMAPEQLRGERVDARADLYAAGAVFYEMATGKRAFSDTQQTRLIDSILHEPPPSPRALNPRISPGLEAILQRAMEKEPTSRYKTAREMLGVLEGLSVGIAPTPASQRTRWPLMAAGLGILSILLLSAIILIVNPDNLKDRLLHRDSTATPGTQTSSLIQGRRSVAVMGFKNLTGRPETEWLSTALAEQLRTELGAGGILRTVPGESVAGATIDLSLTNSDTLAPETLVRLGRILGADLVVLGSYVALSEGKIRLDLRLQDVASGETMLADAETGILSNLFDLVSRAGSKLRAKCGAGTVSEDENTAVRASLPSDPEAARLYSEGLAKLRVFDALGARDLLQKAVILDPNHALAHAALAEAWSALGYDERARQAAENAFGLSAGLSREDRLLVEALYRETSKEWEKAAQIYGTLFGFFSDNLEYGILLAKAHIRGGKGEDALRVLESLRALSPPAGKDPRIDLAAADASYSLGDFKQAQSFASKAVENAKSTGAKLILARALYRLSSTLENLGQEKEAADASDEARGIYEAAGDRIGVASVLEVRADILADQGDLPGAIRTYNQERAIAREVGNKRAEASALNNLALVLAQQGDLAGTRKMYEQALATFREIDDRNNSAMTLINIGGCLQDDGDLAAAKRVYEQALNVSREVNDRNGVAVALSALGAVLDGQGEFASAKKMLDHALALDLENGRKMPSGDKLVNLADLLEDQGDLEGAAKSYHDGLELSRGVGDKRTAAYALFGLGNLALIAADFEHAHSNYQEALTIRNELGEKRNIEETRIAMAKLAMEEGQIEQALVSLHEIRETVQKEKELEFEIVATSLLAQALLAQGKIADAQHELAEVPKTGQKTQNLRAFLEFMIVKGRAAAASGNELPGISILETALATAKKAGFVEYQLEAELALDEIAWKSRRSLASQTKLEKLQANARAKGFQLVALQAAAATK
jgi:eukaryotic-like serine/threonine-protein kinase